MEKAICTQCREKVEYDVAENETPCTIHGEEVTYLERVSHCKKCGEEVWVEDIERGNVCRSIAAYLMLVNKKD